MTARLWSLCVGVSDYGGQPGLPNRPSAVPDACAVDALLRADFGGDGILLAAPRDLAALGDTVADRSSGPGNRADIIQALRDLSRRMAAEDTLLLFFAGQAAAEEPGALLPYGCLVDRISTQLMLSTLFVDLRGMPCRDVILLLDCKDPGLANALPGAGAAPDGNAVAYCAGEQGDAVGGRHTASLHSPFTTALLAHLGKQAVGVPFSAADLDHALHLALTAWGSPAPRFLNWVPSLRSAGQPRLSRTGFGLILPARINGVVGQAIEVSIEVTGHANPAGITIGPTVATTISTPQLAMQSQGRWTVEFAHAGRYQLEFEASDGSGTSLHVVGNCEIVVAASQPKPLEIGLQSLPVWIRGTNSRAPILVQGGSTPYRLLHHAGLPMGLRATTGEAIEIGGIAPLMAGAGSSCSTAGEPVAHDVLLKIGDAFGQTCEVRRRLFLVDEDYIEIPSGEVLVGFHGNPSRLASIAQMLKQYLGPHALAAARKEIERAQSLNPSGRALLGTFWMRKYPVTNFAWRSFLRATKKGHVSLAWPSHDEPYFPDALGTLPVVGISYDAICDYLTWRGTRLPTAREWEKAARGGDGRLFPWGDVFDASKANTLECGKRVLVPVDAHDHVDSPYGVHDLVGNAAEWVDHRVWAGNRFAQPFRGGSFGDPCIQALAFHDSRETGVSWGMARGQAMQGETELPWVGFRDVIDPDQEPPESQGLLTIPAVTLGTGHARREVPAFRIARFAVSNAEYHEFVKATGHAPPLDWNQVGETPFPFAERHLPVTHVSFSDATAFCLWKSRQLDAVIRVIEADHWLAAVDGGQGRPVPWGDSSGEANCNLRGSGFGRLLPVHAMPEGRSVQGAYQLVGNVCEWIAPMDVIGGGWREDLDSLTGSGFRLRLGQTTIANSQGRLDDVGFRYVALSERRA